MHCPECKSKKLAILGTTEYDSTGESIIAIYNLVCEDCQTTFGVQEVYDLKEAVGYYKGEEFYSESYC